MPSTGALMPTRLANTSCYKLEDSWAAAPHINLWQIWPDMKGGAKEEIPKTQLAESKSIHPVFGGSFLLMGLNPRSH